MQKVSNFSSSEELPRELALGDLRFDDFGPLFGLGPDRQYKWSLSSCERYGKPKGLDELVLFYYFLKS